MKLIMNEYSFSEFEHFIIQIRFISPDLRLEIMQELVRKSIVSGFNVFGFLS